MDGSGLLDTYVVRMCMCVCVTFRLLFLRSRIGINYLLNADQVQFRSWKAVNCVILLFHPLSCNASPSMPINIVAYSRTIYNISAST